mmetsp:Transcript_76569/g.236470  ORF Transcript_76569/g.236470 Transcript_76569/m.236470 type:complete len:619 (-) Transcript_76569:158-2014(-)
MEGWTVRPPGGSGPQYTRLIQDAVVSDGGIGMEGASSMSAQHGAPSDASVATRLPEQRSGGTWGRHAKEPPQPPRQNWRAVGSEGEHREHKSSRRPSDAQQQKSAVDQATGRTKHSSLNGSASVLLQGTFTGSLPESVLWTVPALALLVGLFLQNVGLYLGTRCYVRWMDGLQRPSPDSTVATSVQTAVLLDIATAMPYTGRSLGALTQCLDVVTNLLPVVWFGWVTRTRDLRLWTQILLSCALLGMFKGFLAWSTVMPDAEGWQACRERLQKDGLKYYRRQLFDSSTSIDDHDIDLPEALLDILLLEVRGLWLPGVEQRGRFCGDSFFSTPLCRAVLFGLSLCEAIKASSRHLQARTQLIVRTTARCLCGAVVLGNAVLSLLNRYQYSVEVAMALVLALLVYSNPAIAVAVQHWCQGAREAPALAPSPPSQRDAAVTAGACARASLPQAMQQEPPLGVEGLPEEVGRVPLSPFCFVPPGASLDGFVYLRAGAVQLPTEEVSQDVRQLQLEHLKGIKAQLLRSRRLKEEQIVEVHAEAQTRAAQAAEEARRRLEERLAKQAMELEAESQHLLEEASRREGEDQLRELAADCFQQASRCAAGQQAGPVSARDCTAGCLL